MLQAREIFQEMVGSRELTFASQQIMSEGLPENELALRIAAFAFAFTDRIGIVLTGGTVMDVAEGHQCGGQHQGGE